MRNLSVLGMLCMICTCAFCTPSLRASSIPLNHQPTLAAPKTITTTATGTSTDSDTNTTTTESTSSTNDSRISFTAPIKNSPRYYIPTGNSNSGSNTGNSGNTSSDTAADIAAIQQQIDKLLTQQQRFEDSVRTTVQTEIKNSDLTKNASFNDIVSNLQESAPSMTQVNETINEKISDTLVEKGIVNNRGQLLVATTDEIQPLALSQKLESTLATKFAKKADVAPAKLAADIATNEAAVQTLAARVGTNENDVKTLIASDLKQRGIINSNNTLNVATKSELPVVDTETVAQALQNSAQFDNMISQNLISKGIYDSNKQLQVLKKNELTPELLTTKLDSTYAKTTDITPEKLSSKLNNIYARKSELPTINEETVSAALANSTTLDNSVIKTLKRKNILDSNENLNVATKAELPTEALQQQIDSLQSAQTNLARNQLTRADVTSTVQAMDLTTNPELQTTLTSIRTSNQNLQAAVASVQQKTNNLDANIDTKLRERGLVDNNNTALFASKTEITPEIIAQNIANSNTAKATLSGKLGPNTDTVNALITQKLKDKGLVTDDANANRRVLTSADLETALSGKNYATKNELPTINEDTVSAALANSTTLDNTVIKTLKNKGLLDKNTEELNVATKEDVDVVNIADKIAKSTSAKEKLAGQLGTSEDDVKAILVDKGLLKDDANNTLNVATKTELEGLDSKFATKGEAGTSESKVNELISTQLVTKGIWDLENNKLNVASKEDVDVVNIADKIAKSTSAKEKLAGQLGTSEDDVKTILVDTGILDNDKATLKIATKTELEGLDSKFATKGEAGTSESKVNELIITKLKGKGIISNDDKETLQLATTAQLNALDSAVTNLDGDISNPDSLLYKIKHNASIQQDLKGEKGDKGDDGSSVSLSEVTSALKGDQNFLDSVKGKDGTGYTLKGSVENYSDLPKTNNTQGDGWYVEQTGLLYVYSCDSNGENCTYPIITKGLPFKGEKGTSFNYTGECGWSSTIPSCIKTQEGSACAHTDGKLYICSCNGENCEYKGTKLKGDDGVSPKSVEQQYCEDNLAIVQKLYPSKNIETAADCADTSKFSNAEYSAIMGGSKAYCLSLTKDLVAGKLSFTSGIGKKLAATLDNGSSTKLTSFKNQNIATVLDKSTSTYKFGDKNFMEACEEKYNEIMSGEKGSDGVAGDSAAETWCKAHSAQYTDKKTNQIRTISAPTALPASKGLTAFNALKTKKGLNDTQIAAKLDTTTRIFASVEDCVAAVEADPGIMEGKSEADKEFDENNTNLTLNDTNVTGLNNFRSGFKETLKGKTASDTWCEANFNKDFSFAKSTRVKAIAGAKLTTNSSTGIGKFATVQDCKDAMNTNENLFAEVLKGESASDQAVNEEFTKADDKSTVISKYGNVTKLSTWATDGFKASLKGDAGTGITYRGSVPTYEDLPATSTVQQGDAYYNEEDGKMYTATCTNNTCAFPAKGQGNQYRGAAGRDGTTYIPEVNASTGMLKWKNTNGDYFDIAAVKVKGEDGDTFTPTYNNGRLVIKNKAGTTIVNEQVKGEDGITYEPNVSAAGVLTWKNSKTNADSGITGVNIKGEKGDNGATFTPTFDSTTGKLSWASDKAGVTLPSEMKIAKTDSELGTLVANKISADTTLAKKDDITGAKLEEALGNRFTKTADVNGLILSDLQNRGIVSTDSTPRALFATASDVNGLISRTSALETTASKALTTDNLKNSAVVSALNTAGIITSDNADTKLTSFAKTADVVTKTGFSSQLQADLDKNDSTIKTALGNTFAAKGTVDSLSGTIATLTGGEDDTGSIANKIKTAKTTIESGIDTKLTGYATTGTVTDLTTRTASLETNALTTGNLADKLSASNSTVKKAFSDAGFAKTADVVTNNDFKSKLQTNLADSEVKSALATAGFAKTDDVVTKTGFAAQLQSDLNAENSTVKSALATAGFAKTADVVTNNDFKSKLKTNLADSEVKTALSGAGFAKTADVVTNNDFKSKLKTNLADSEVKTALSGAGFAQSSEIATTVNNTLNGTGEGSFASRLSNAGVITASNAANTLTGFAKSTELASLSNNVVTKNNLATELTSNTAQTALANAGFATKSNITNDVKNDVFTLSDFSRLLSSGGLEVDNTGKLKLADTTTNAAAANINTKLIAAKANDASIQTTGLTATSNITSSIASVAASAAGEGEIKDQATCNKHEYMYWTGSACTKCPDGTYFDANASTRCVCKDSALTFSGGSCIKATMTSDKCSGANGAGMYYTGSTCEKCPKGTYFNETSMSNTSLPRCICEDKSLEFNASSGKCTAASSCAATKTVANPKEGGKCQECPKEFPFLQETGSCACPAGTTFNTYRWGCAECGAAGAEYNEMTKSCTCPDPATHMDTEQWKCVPNK